MNNNRPSPWRFKSFQSMLLSLMILPLACSEQKPQVTNSKKARSDKATTQPSSLDSFPQKQDESLDQLGLTGMIQTSIEKKLVEAGIDKSKALAVAKIAAGDSIQSEALSLTRKRLPPDREAEINISKAQEVALMYMRDNFSKEERVLAVPALLFAVAEVAGLVDKSQSKPLFSGEVALNWAERSDDLAHDVDLKAVRVLPGMADAYEIAVQKPNAAAEIVSEATLEEISYAEPVGNGELNPEMLEMLKLVLKMLSAEGIPEELRREFRIRLGTELVSTGHKPEIPQISEPGFIGMEPILGNSVEARPDFGRFLKLVNFDSIELIKSCVFTNHVGLQFVPESIMANKDDVTVMFTRGWKGPGRFNPNTLNCNPHAKEPMIVSATDTGTSDGAVYVGEEDFDGIANPFAVPETEPIPAGEDHFHADSAPEVMNDRIEHSQDIEFIKPDPVIYNLFQPIGVHLEPEFGLNPEDKFAGLKLTRSEYHPKPDSIHCRNVSWQKTVTIRKNGHCSGKPVLAGKRIRLEIAMAKHGLPELRHNDCRLYMEGKHHKLISVDKTAIEGIRELYFGRGYYPTLMTEDLNIALGYQRSALICGLKKPVVCANPRFGDHLTIKGYDCFYNEDREDPHGVFMNHSDPHEPNFGVSKPDIVEDPDHHPKVYKNVKFMVGRYVPSEADSVYALDTYGEHTLLRILHYNKEKDLHILKEATITVSHADLSYTALADINGDGFDDLVTLSHFESGQDETDGYQIYALLKWFDARQNFAQMGEQMVLYNGESNQITTVYVGRHPSWPADRFIIHTESPGGSDLSIPELEGMPKYSLPALSSTDAKFSTDASYIFRSEPMDIPTHHLLTKKLVQVKMDNDEPIVLHSINDTNHHGLYGDYNKDRLADKYTARIIYSEDGVSKEFGFGVEVKTDQDAFGFYTGLTIKDHRYQNIHDYFK